MRIAYFPPDVDFAEKCAKALRSIPKGANLVLDLRGNAGGSGPNMSKLRGMLLPKGAAVSRTRLRIPGGAFTPWSIDRESDEPIYTGPITVLMDEYCASSTEGLIGALKANRRAKLLGRRSAGSTGAPRSFTTAEGVSFSCSSFEETTPEGEPIEGHGVTTKVWRG